MSPSAVHTNSAGDQFESNLNLSICGLGVEYPPFLLGPEALETLANRFYKESTALQKVLSINRYTGIDTRAAIGDVDHPLVNQRSAPSITKLNDYFRQEGVRLSVNACNKAIKEWGGQVDEITHVVSTTCTNSANPGFDHYVIKQLGLKSGVERVLLHGIGCSGGLAAIRTACNLALGSSFRRKPARVLVIACEISSLLVRSELDSIDQDQAIRIGVCLFSDCASSIILSNGIGEDDWSRGSIYDILGWRHEILADTDKDLGFDVNPLGWKVVLTHRVPGIASAAVLPAFNNLIHSLPPQFDKPNHDLNSSSPSPPSSIPSAAEFDWALHPGGSIIIRGVEESMNLTEQHLQASYEIYTKYGNSSSATIISVLSRLRQLEQGRKHVIACAFGPGIALEMMVLRRRRFPGGAQAENGERDREEMLGLGEDVDVD